MSEKQTETKSNSNINWFPGHMAKAKREMSENVKLVDMIIEIRDARVPLSSRNPLLNEVTSSKPRMIVLSKKDKAEPQITQQWIDYLTKQGYMVIACDLIHDKNIPQRISQACQQVMAAKIAKLKAKGMKHVEIKAMVVGIPNVGKSTLINSVLKKKIAKTADKPGVTRNLQWIKVSQDVALLDTPGVLWPKFEDQRTGYVLAVTGAINDNILPMDEVVTFAVQYLMDNHSEKLKERYGIEVSGDVHKCIDDIAISRNWVKQNNEIDYERTYALILKEIRDNQLGNISWEKCDEDGQ